MIEKQKIIPAFGFFAIFPIYVFCFWLLYKALINQRVVFDLACCNIGFSLLGVTLTGFIALRSSPDTPKKLLAFSHTFFILSIVSAVSFFVMVAVVTAILAMLGFLWGLCAIVTNLTALPFFYKKVDYWIYMITEFLWAGFAVFSMFLAAEISASC